MQVQARVVEKYNNVIKVVPSNINAFYYVALISFSFSLSFIVLLPNYNSFYPSIYFPSFQALAITKRIGNPDTALCFQCGRIHVSVENRDILIRLTRMVNV